MGPRPKPRRGGAARLSRLHTPGNHLPHTAQVFTSLTEDTQGRVRTNVDSSLARFEDGAWRQFGQKQGLRANVVTTVFGDRAGTVWFGMSGHGLDKWLGYDSWEHWTEAEGLPQAMIWAIYRDSTGCLWVGHERGLATLNGATRRFEPVPVPRALAGQRVQSIAESKDGYLWIGTATWRVAIVDRKTHRVRLINFDGGSVNRILVDRDDRAWVASKNGLFVSMPSKSRDSLLNPLGPTFNAGQFADLAESPGGRLFARAQTSLFRFDNGSWARLDIAGNELGGIYADIAVDCENSLWTDGDFAGIKHYELNGTQIVSRRSFAKPELASDQQLLAAHDRRGWIWLGEDNGITMFDGKSWHRLNEDDGLIWNDCDSKAFWADADGTVWIGTSGGLSHVNPAGWEKQPAPELRLLGASYGREQFPELEDASFPWTGQALSFQLAALNFRNERSIRISYRLSGVDLGWSEADRGEVHYPQINPGTYSFDAVDFDRSTATQSEPVHLTFRVTPPWWRTTWFYAALLLCLAMLAALVLRRRTRALLARHQELERMVAERTEELDRKKAEAELASRAKSEFLATMSHEIRTPLNGVLGMTSVLLNSTITEEQRECIDAIRVSGECLLTVINDILDYSKIEAGKLELDPVPFDLRLLLRECVQVMREAAGAKDLTLDAAVDPNVPSWLIGDPVRLRQILLNLLSNAVKFTPNGGHVSASIDCGPHTSSQLVPLFVSVTDPGIGIAPDKQSKLFGSFFQVDASTTRKFGGTGLGLAISKRLVVLMGGQIGVESKEGQGSTFWFRISLLRAEPPETAERDGVNGSGLRMLSASLGGSARKRAEVLVIEDNEINQRVATHLLSRLGCAASVAANGMEGVAMARGKRFDLILMDCQMPEMDGFEATRALRANGGASHNSPIIALTANVLDGERERCLDAGMNDYLAKPIEAAHVEALLNTWLPPVPDSGELAPASLEAS